MTVHANNITDEVPADGRYYAQGEHVRRAPIATKIKGGTSYEVGFTVCRMSAYVPDAAPIVAAALNAYANTLKAAKIIQDKAAGHHLMARHYADASIDAQVSPSLYSLGAHYRSLAIEEQRAGAEASLMARKMVGVEL